MTEDYVSFETAKLLKEKGFDWLESPFYSEQDRVEWRRNTWYCIPNPCYDENIPFDSPTLYVTTPHISIQMAMKWLREVHKMNIEIITYWTKDKRVVYGNRIVHNGTVLKEIDTAYNSYEESCEMAIKFCLENLV